MPKTIEKYTIPRHRGFEGVLEPLVKRITGVSQGNLLAGCEFENDVIKMKPHFIGACPCKYGEEYKKYCEKNTHTLDCFHSYVEEINKAFKSHPKYHIALPLKTERINMLKSLCLKNNMPFKSEREVEKLCTCGFNDKWKMLMVEHEENCPVVTPNFIYKISDLKIWWNRVFFRDAYSNKPIKLDEFEKIIREVVSTVPKITS